MTPETEMPRSFKIAFALFVIFIGVLLSISAYEMGKRAEQIDRLNQQNQLLKKTNDSLLLSVKRYEDTIAVANNKILALSNMEALLKLKAESLQLKINKLKPKYEKAGNYARNFNADSVRIYFSNLR